jgi:hypothetical protein
VPPPAEEPAAPPGEVEYAASVDGLCQRLQDCGCNPMASVVACAKQAGLAQVRAEAAHQAASPPQPGAIATRVDFSEYLYNAANGRCELACAAHGQGVSFPPAPVAPTPVTTPNPAAPTEPPAPATPAPVATTLIIRTTDGGWFDLKLDGAPHGIRNSSELKIRLSPGTHTLAVAEFMDDTPHARAKVEGGQLREVIVGIAAGKPVECYTDGCQPL